MLLKNKHAKHANIKLNLPIVGEVQMTDGIVDVPKNVHDLLIGDGLNEWATGEEVETEPSGFKSTDGKDQFEEMVNALTFEEVIDLAKEAQIKNYQIFSKNEKAMRTYVIKKLREIEEDSELEAEAIEALRLSDESNKDDDSDKTGSPLDEE